MTSMSPTSILASCNASLTSSKIQPLWCSAVSRGRNPYKETAKIQHITDETINRMHIQHIIEGSRRQPGAYLCMKSEILMLMLILDTAITIRLPCSGNQDKA